MNLSETLASTEKKLLSQSLEKNFGLYKKIKAAYEERDTSLPLADDFDFLQTICNAFPTNTTAPKYDENSLKNRSLQRINMIQSNIGPIAGKNILDIGCGRGENLPNLVELGAASATGIDMDKKLAAEFEEKWGDVAGTEFVLGDLHEHDFNGKKFDCIISFDSLEHFKDPLTILKRAAELLAPGGILFASCNPLFHSPWGSHHYRVAPAPYVSNLFSDPVVVKHLERAPGSDPYIALNRYALKQFIDIFNRLEGLKVEVFDFHYNWEYIWFAQIFRKEMAHLGPEDLYIAGFNIVFRKQ